MVIVALLATAVWPGRSIAAPPTFAIQAGDLADALALFAQQSRQQLLFAPQAVRGRRGHAVRGSMPPDQALARLLRGTGFHAEQAPGGAWLIVPDAAPVAKPVIRPAPVLPAPPAGPAAGPPVLQDIVIVGTAGGGTARRDAAYALTTIDQPAIERLGTEPGLRYAKKVVAAAKEIQRAAAARY